VARIRTVKPEFFRHERLQDLEAANPGANVMLVFCALWGHCDKNGIFEYRPRTLKLDILPFLDFDREATLRVLASAGLIRIGEAGGKQWGSVGSFTEHQRLGGKEAQEPSKNPHPDTIQWLSVVNASGSNGEALGKQQGLQEGKGREGKGTGREQELSVELKLDTVPGPAAEPEEAIPVTRSEEHTSELQSQLR
jgi:hypothetical protein